MCSRIHLIPDIDDESSLCHSQVDGAACQASKTTTSTSEASPCAGNKRKVFIHASSMMRKVGGNIIMKEAVAVNRRLTEVLMRNEMSLEGDNNVIRAKKRQRLSSQREVEAIANGGEGPDVDNNSIRWTSAERESVDRNNHEEAEEPFTHEEHASIWEQAERAKRMAALLRNIEVLQNMFYQELTSCEADEDKASSEGSS